MRSVPPAFIAVVLVAASLHAADYNPLEDKGRPIAKTEALSADAAAKQFQLPPGFSAQVVASEPDVVQPVAFTTDDRGRIWVLENTNYPNCPGEPRDKSLIFEDTDGDGRAEKRTVFFDKRNCATGLALSHGGVWVGATPNLRVISNKNGDDIPDGAPEKLLDGWGWEDTHETINNLTWGPDGWLYGTQGIFTNSKVGALGTPDKDRTPINAGVWRFHPTKKKFELYAEGASNQWGIDWNDHGQAFFEACVIPHVWQCIQGARYQRQAGQHFNKFTYEDIKTIADFDTRSAHSGAMIYLGGQWPAEYRDSFFFHDIPLEQLRAERMGAAALATKPRASSFFFASPDAWYRGIAAIRPDGRVLIDWYDKVPCQATRLHRPRDSRSTSSRKGAKKLSASILAGHDAELVTSVERERLVNPPRAASCRSAGPKPKSTPRSRESAEIPTTRANPRTVGAALHRRLHRPLALKTLGSKRIRPRVRSARVRRRQTARAARRVRAAREGRPVAVVRLTASAGASR